MDSLNQNFDILDYLNNIYMQKMGNQINVLQAGGHHNIHDNDKENKVDEEILEINKKRINIPDAEIKFFSYRQQGDIEPDNETKDDTSPINESEQDGERHNDSSSEGEQERGSSGVLAGQEVVEI